MSTVVSVSRQVAHPPTSTPAEPHKAPLQLAGRLLAQFEDDLRTGDNLRARLVNTALLELQELLPPDQAILIEQGISDAWRRACGWDF